MRVSTFPLSLYYSYRKLIDEEDARRGDGTSLGPTLVRLAWHCAGTYSKVRVALRFGFSITAHFEFGLFSILGKVDGSGGSNGCRMRFNPEAGWGANAGLATARNFLNPLRSQFPGLSFADL